MSHAIAPSTGGNWGLNLPTLPPTYPTPTPKPSYPSYPAPPSYPATPALSGDYVALASKAGPHIPGAVAGYQAKEGLRLSVQAVRRSRSARYGYGYGYRTSSYRYGGYRTSSRGRARVGPTTGGFFGRMMGAVKVSALVAGGLSLVTNGLAVRQGRQDVPQAGAAIAGDVAAGAVGGVGATLLSTVGLKMMGATLTGGSATLIGIGLGIAGAFLAERWFRQTELSYNIENTAYRLLSGMSGR